MQKNNWKKCKLGDVAEITSSKRIFLADYVKEGVPFYRSKEIIERSSGRSITTPLFISEEKYEQIINKYGAPIAGDLLLTSVGTLGIPYRVSPTDKFYFKDGNLTWFRKLNNILCDYLYYFFLSPIGKEKLALIAIGSTQKALTINALQGVTLSLPSLEEQKRIAEILGSLDDKIELLQKQNKTLEDMAKALFKSWFVDFDVVRAKQKGLPKADIMREYHLTDELYELFPSSFADSPLGPIPSGWEVKPLKDLASITAGKRPKQVKDIKDDNFFIPVYGGNGIKWWTNVSLYSTPIIITGRVGTLGKVYRIYEPVWVSDNALIFEVQKEHFEYLLYMLYTIDFNSFNRGSTQPLITQSDMKEILVVFGQDIVQKFHSIIVEYEKKINNNNRQIQTLTELRDALLPRLISGKIRV